MCMGTDLSAKFEILKVKKQNIRTELVLFRTISVSLIWFGYDKK